MGDPTPLASDHRPISFNEAMQAPELNDPRWRHLHEARAALQAHVKAEPGRLGRIIPGTHSSSLGLALAYIEGTLQAIGTAAIIASTERDG